MENFSLPQIVAALVFVQVTFFAVLAQFCSLAVIFVPDIEKRIGDFYDENIAPFFEFFADAWNQYRRDSVFLRPQIGWLETLQLNSGGFINLDKKRFEHNCRRKSHLSGITSVHEANKVGTGSAYYEEWDGA